MREARKYIRERLDSSLPIGKLMDVELLASELVANTVRHAQPRPGATFSIDIEVAPRTVRVSIEEAGPGLGALRDPREPGGWNLALVERIADRWGIQPAHPSVWFEMDR